MRIIKEKTLRDFYAKHPQAKPGLCHWYNVASQAKWRKPTDVVASTNGQNGELNALRT